MVQLSLFKLQMFHLPVLVAVLLAVVSDVAASSDDDVRYSHPSYSDVITDPPYSTCDPPYEVEVADGSTMACPDNFNIGYLTDTNIDTVWYNRNTNYTILMDFNRYIFITSVSIRLLLPPEDVEFQIWRRIIGRTDYHKIGDVQDSGDGTFTLMQELDETSDKATNQLKIIPNTAVVLGYQELEVAGREAPVNTCMNDCYEYGKRPQSICYQRSDVWQCRCRDFADITFAGEHCHPYVESVTPAYGPLYGGTLLEFRGKLLATSPAMTNDTSEVSVIIGDQYNCTVVEFSDVYIACITLPSLQDSDLDTRYNISITVAWGQQLVRTGPAALTFTYKHNPTITNVTAYATFPAGGLRFTVHGAYLNSLYKPEVYIETKNTGQVFTSDVRTTCITHHGYMFCDYPAFQYKNVRRARRSTRIRRQDTTHCDTYGLLNMHNHNTIDYIRLFIALNVEHTINMEQEIGQSMCVYRDPELDVRVDGVITIKTYQGNGWISITGHYLQGAATADSYVITVGSGENEGDVVGCQVKKFDSLNRIECEPERMPNGDGPHNVTVRVGNIAAVVRRVRFEQSLWENTTFKIILFVCLGAVVLLAVLITLWWCWRVRPKRPDWLTLLSSEMQKVVNKFLVEKEKLQYSPRDKIGQGQFGNVYKGLLRLDPKGQTRPREVAVKTIKDDWNIGAEKIEEFLREALVMKDFNHENVLELLAIGSGRATPVIVVPYMKDDCLLKHIRSNKNVLTPAHLLQMARQIACGMEYIASHRVVHRDLACRNCLIDGTLIKVADFGLSSVADREKNYVKNDQQQRALPLRWMSIETLEGEPFTTMSDVWSFGVVLYELYTFGQRPYNDLKRHEDVKSRVINGYIMSPPRSMPNEIATMMLACWARIPQDRPTFSQLYQTLKSLEEGDYTIPIDMTG